MNERAEILRRLQAGEISPEEALQLMIAFWVSVGQSEQAAQEFATQDIQELSETEIANVESASIQEPAFGPGATSLQSVFEQLPGQIVSPFSAERSGETPTTAFQGFVGSRFPSGVGSGAEGALRNQFAAIQPAFTALQGFGDLPPGASFPAFLGRNLGRSNINPKSIASRSADLFGQDLDPDSSQFQFRQSLLRNPQAQFELALQSALQGVPEAFAPGVRAQAARSFGEFQTSVPLNPETGLPLFEENPFLPRFAEQGFRRQGRR